MLTSYLPIGHRPSDSERQRKLKSIFALAMTGGPARADRPSHYSGQSAAQVRRTGCFRTRSSSTSSEVRGRPRPVVVVLRPEKVGAVLRCASASVWNSGGSGSCRTMR